MDEVPVQVHRRHGGGGPRVDPHDEEGRRLPRRLEPDPVELPARDPDLDVASPVGATTDFLSMAAHRRLLSKVLRDPEFYFLNKVLGPSDRTRQPYAPERWGYFEFDFYTAAGAERALAAAGFRVIDRMALAPISAYRGRLTTIARRERRTWRNLLAVEERAGRRPGTLETGHGFVVAAVRATPRGRRRSRA